MDILLNVLTALGVNKTIFIQFFIFVILFLVLKKLLFSKLLEVLLDREEKTVVTEKNSDTLLDEAKTLEQKYKDLVGGIYKKYQDKYGEEKKEIMDEEDGRFRHHEEQVMQKEQQLLDEIKIEITQLKEESFKAKGNLKDELLSKLS